MRNSEVANNVGMFNLDKKNVKLYFIKPLASNWCIGKSYQMQVKYIPT